MALPRVTRFAACALSVASLAGLSACSSKTEPGKDEPAREGLALNVAGVEYNVFITRELNLKITPDEGYYDGPPAKPGHALYGIFIQACNQGKGTVRSAEDFKVVDNQGEEFEPIKLPERNGFAYHPRSLGASDCIPAAGSVAQQGPTAGAMLLFDFPLLATENRPLELEISGPYNYGTGRRETKSVQLDL